MPAALKFAIYARKSTESEDRQVASISDQVGDLQAIAERERLTIIGVYTAVVLSRAVRQLRRFREDASFSSHDVSKWTREQCQSYLRAPKK